jgi:biopolymer transport protein ExbB
MLESVADYFRSGGAMMWVILALGGTAAALVAERLHFYLGVCRDDADTLVTGAVRKLNTGDVAGAAKVVNTKPSPAAAILVRAIGSFGDGKGVEAIRRDAEEVAIREVPRYGRRLGYLATIASISTLLGLLGTIFGLQQSFSSLAVTDAAQKASVLAAGIAQAMNTTSFGLIVAIPCLLAHSRLVSLQARRTEECDAAAVKLLNYFETREQVAGPALVGSAGR